MAEMTKKQRDEYYKQETKELWGGKGDLMFYGGIGIMFVGFLLAIVIVPIIFVIGILGVFLMFYGVYYDWSRTKTGIGKAGNIIALIMALIISLVYFLMLFLIAFNI